MNFKIYKSSAGSGKTFTLTKEYLKLALVAPGMLPNFKPIYFRSILAVTFTNDAANEMKERIMDHLSEIAHLNPGEEQPMLALILSEIPEEYPEVKLSREQVIERAARVHETLLHNYADFSVSTIDAFNNRIVQSFKKDLNLPFNYEVELETDDLLDESTDNLQDEVGAGLDKALSDLIVEFALNKADSNNSWYIDEDLKSFGQNIFNEEKYESIQNLQDLTPRDFQKIKNDLFAYLKKVENQVSAVAEKAYFSIIDQGLNATHFYYSGKGIFAYFENHFKIKKKINELDPNSYVLKTINEDKWYGSKAQAFEKNVIDSVIDELIAAFHEIEGIKTREMANYMIAYSLRKNIYLLATINELDKKIKEIKADKNLVHISDFNRKINLIVEEEPVPYIYERLGERYNHILIDEFQDTSKMQWHNLIPLMVNALGKGSMTLIVGDAKQAIYRWRGGKSEMLVKLPDLPTAAVTSPLKREAAVFKRQSLIQSLNTNYRSKDNVIHFNNGIFTALRESLIDTFPEVGEFYNEVFQECSGKSGGHVEVEFVEKALPKPSFELLNYAKTLEIIQHVTKDLNYDLSDVAILTRNNGHGAFLAEKLIDDQIPVISSESLLLHNAPEVKFLVDFLRIIHHPTNPTLKADLLLYLSKHYEKLGESFEKIDGARYKEIAEVAKEINLLEFTKLIKEYFNTELYMKSLQFLSIYEITEELIRTFRLNELEKSQIYIQKFLDVVLKFSIKKGNNLLDFLEYWDKKEGKLSISTPKEGNAVRIMSIHKSKGLQFPIVIIPFANWGLQPKPGTTMWRNWNTDKLSKALPSVILTVGKDLERTEFKEDYHQELEATFLDGFNLMYVAFTRAEEKLFMISQDSAKPEALKSIADLLCNYKMLQKGEMISTNEEITIENQKGESSLVNIEKVVFYKDEKPEKVRKASKNTDETELSSQQILRLEKFYHTESRDKIRMRKSSDRDLEKDISIHDMYSARKQGILLHYAFEKIKYNTDIEKAIATLITEGLINETEQDKIRKSLSAVMKIPEIKRYYDPEAGVKIKNEKELILGTKKGKGLQSLRPDRIVRDGKELVIIDYKTGGEDPKKYGKQIRKYARVFKDMGYQDIKMFIVYTELLKASEVK
ncbi:MAG: UvrD-helicase domain-containing protein [Flammeovirgaceae bacterium]|nr:UvrD-helicase domain-containing protein [Flammeovirgaceae bacterium]